MCSAGQFVEHHLPETFAHRLGAQHEQVEFAGVLRRRQQREEPAFEEVLELILQITRRCLSINREALLCQQAVHVEEREVVRASSRCASSFTKP